MSPLRRDSFGTRGQIDRPVDLPFVFPAFLREILVCLCLALGFLSGAAVASGRTHEEFRGLWVARHWLKNREQAMRAVRIAVNARLNALLVQVRGRGDAFYRSRLVPRSDSLSDPEFDPLALLVEEGRRAGLEVHAWVNMYLTWKPTEQRPASPRHLFLRRPEWFMRSADGIDMGRVALDGVDLVKRGVTGRFLSPGIPEVRAHLLGVIEEIVDEYDIDGIHMDYVRYPNIHYDYSPAVSEAFKTRYGFDPPGRNDRDAGAGAGAADVRKLWHRWRSEQVSLLVGQVREAMARRKPAVRLSAAVKPDIESAHTQYGQDWMEWSNGGLVDFVVPMFYEGSTLEIERQMAEARKRVKKAVLYAGIGIWNQNADETVAQIEIARRKGFQGVVFFSVDGFVQQKGLTGDLNEGPFRTPSALLKEEDTRVETQAGRSGRD
ncbi:MAG: family 10 glycosylhydrolase [Gemmatimonadota bacterium]|nr:family 10 glycosylhydrolase [Gemmatimonadota bacterium]